MVVGPNDIRPCPGISPPLVRFLPPLPLLVGVGVRMAGVLEGYPCARNAASSSDLHSALLAAIFWSHSATIFSACLCSSCWCLASVAFCLSAVCFLSRASASSVFCFSSVSCSTRISSCVCFSSLNSRSARLLSVVGALEYASERFEDFDVAMELVTEDVSDCVREWPVC